MTFSVPEYVFRISGFGGSLGERERERQRERERERE
jgi:hypothetical protein